MKDVEGRESSMKWHPVTCTDPWRDMLYGSEKPEVDGSTPSLTTTEIPCAAGDFIVLESPPARPEARPGRAEGAIFSSGSFQ